MRVPSESGRPAGEIKRRPAHVPLNLPYRKIALHRSGDLAAPVRPAPRPRACCFGSHVRPTGNARRRLRRCRASIARLPRAGRAPDTAGQRNINSALSRSLAATRYLWRNSAAEQRLAEQTGNAKRSIHRPYIKLGATLPARSSRPPTCSLRCAIRLRLFSRTARKKGRRIHSRRTISLVVNYAALRH